MNDMSALNFYHYEHLFKFTKDELSLQELYLLKERCPLFDFSCYKPGVFTLPNIRKFSETFLLDNYHLLSESILELSKNKVPVTKSILVIVENFIILQITMSIMIILSLIPIASIIL